MFCKGQLKTTNSSGGSGGAPTPPGGSGSMLDNDLSSVVLQVSGNLYDLNPENISDKYESTDPIKLVISGNFDDIIQLQRITAKIFFTSTQDGQSVTFSHVIGQVEMMGLDYSGMSFYDMSSPHYVGLWDNRFVVRAQNPTDFTVQAAEIANHVFTHYIFKLICFLTSSSLTKSLQRDSVTYDPTEKTYEFTCDDGSETENTQCRRFYAEAQNQNFSCSFETIFYDDQELVFLEQLTLSKAATCWDDMLIELHDAKVCMVLENLKSHTECDRIFAAMVADLSKTTLTFIMKNSLSPGMQLQIPQKFDLK